MSDLTSSTPVVASSLVSRFHSLNEDPLWERPVQRFRITGKHAAVKRMLESSGEYPARKRWKWSILQGLGHVGEEVGSPPDLLPRIGHLTPVICCHRLRLRLLSACSGVGSLCCLRN